MSPPSSESKNKLNKKPAWKQVASRAKLIFRPWRCRRHVPPKHQLTFNRLHGVISQKVELFIFILWFWTVLLKNVLYSHFAHVFYFSEYKCGMNSLLRECLKSCRGRKFIPMESLYKAEHSFVTILVHKFDHSGIREKHFKRHKAHWYQKF
jgi:hypothetical protein